MKRTDIPETSLVRALRDSVLPTDTALDAGLGLIHAWSLVRDQEQGEGVTSEAKGAPLSTHERDMWMGYIARLHAQQFEMFTHATRMVESYGLRFGLAVEGTDASAEERATELEKKVIELEALVRELRNALVPA